MVPSHALKYTVKLTLLHWGEKITNREEGHSILNRQKKKKHRWIARLFTLPGKLTDPGFSVTGLTEVLASTRLVSAKYISIEFVEFSLGSIRFRVAIIRSAS